MSTLLAYLLSVIFLLIFTTILYFKHAFSYWRKRGVPVQSPSIPFGNIGPALYGTKAVGIIAAETYKELRSKKSKHGGMYFVSAPVYIPVDPEIIKNILIRDFQYFMDRGIFYDEVNQPITAHLFALGGTKWKNLRTKLTPTFTSGKLKMMFDTVLDRANNLKEVCDEYAENHLPLDVKEILSRFATDSVGSCAFGVECNSLKNPEGSGFRKAGKKFFQQSVMESAKNVLSFGNPELAKFLQIDVIAPEVCKFFLKSIAETISYREENNIKRNDFLHLLIQLKNKGHVNEESAEKNQEMSITMNEAAAQAFIFFAGGTDTSATAITFCLLELALNEKLQDQAREEVQRVIRENGNKLTYDAINQLKFLDMVLSETLRKYPPLMFLMRICLKDYHIPELNLTLEKGTMVYVSVLGIHRDPEFYPDPDKFDPERFSEENKSNRNSVTYLPFGEGPRVCIGMRFGLMQVKIGLCMLLNNFSFSYNSQTKLPMECCPTSFVLQAKDPIMLNVEKLKKEDCC